MAKIPIFASAVRNFASAVRNFASAGQSTNLPIVFGASAGLNPELEKPGFSVRSLHREHSGAVAFLELKTLLKFGDVSGLEICVASPAYALSDDSQRIIRRAKANLE